MGKKDPDWNKLADEFAISNGRVIMRDQEPLTQQQVTEPSSEEMVSVMSGHIPFTTRIAEAILNGNLGGELSDGQVELGPLAQEIHDGFAGLTKIPLSERTLGSLGITFDNQKVMFFQGEKCSELKFVNDEQGPHFELPESGHQW